MMSHRPVAFSIAAVATSVAALLTPGVARAVTTCSQNSDCAHGFTCQTSGTTACPAIACAPNSNCPPINCTQTVTKECIPGPCATDSDCAAGMVCYAEPTSTCATAPPTPACDPQAGPCTQPAPFDAGACTQTTVKSCVPRWVLPCTQNSDCGDGFTCMADMACGCAGSAGGVPLSGGAGVPTTPNSPPALPASDASAPPAPSCSCTQLTTSHCSVNTLPCTSDTNCPSMWTCVQPPTNAATYHAACVQVGPGDSGPSPCPGMPAPTPEPSVCQPPYYDLGGAALSESTGGSASVPAAANGAGSQDTTGTGAPPKSGASPASGGNESGGGCSIGRGSGGAGAGLGLILLGLVAAARRGRRGGATGV